MMSTTPTRLFDRALIEARRRRARRIGPATFLLDRVAEDFADRLATVLRRFERAVDLGTPTPAVRDALAGNGAIGTMIAVARAFDGPTVSPRVVADTMPLRVVADDEALPFADGSLDLVVSAFALQTVDDLPGALIQIRRALKPDGLLLAALLGGDTLTELRESFAVAESELTGGVSPRVAPFADLRDMGALLQRAGFALPVTDIDRVVVRYSSPLALMADLRRMGATNPLVERRRVPLRRDVLARLLEVYAERFGDPDGKVRASFDIVWLSGWAPHESQQQPLRPGSAKARLADALGTREISAGEKPERQLTALLAHVLQRRDDLAVERVLDALADRAQRAEDGERDQRRHQPVFDRGGAALVGSERGEDAREGRRGERWLIGGFHAVSGFHTSAVRCGISGMSASGIGYSRSRFGRTQASCCPSLGITVPSQRRHT